MTEHGLILCALLVDDGSSDLPNDLALTELWGNSVSAKASAFGCIFDGSLQHCVKFAFHFDGV